MRRLTLAFSLVFLTGLFALSGPATKAYAFDISDVSYRTVSWHRYWVDDDAPVVREHIVRERDFDGPVVREERRIIRDERPTLRERVIIRNETPRFTEREIVTEDRPGLSIGLPFFSFHLG